MTHNRSKFTQFGNQQDDQCVYIVQAGNDKAANPGLIFDHQSLGTAMSSCIECTPLLYILCMLYNLVHRKSVV